MSPHELSNPFASDGSDRTSTGRAHDAGRSYEPDDSHVRRRLASVSPKADGGVSSTKKLLAEHPILQIGRSAPVPEETAALFEDEPELPPLGTFLQPFIGAFPDSVLRKADLLPTPAKQAAFLKTWKEGPGSESQTQRAARKSHEFAQMGEAMYRAYGDSIPTTQYKKRDLTDPGDRAAEVASIREMIARRDAKIPPPIPPEVAAASRAHHRNLLIGKALDELRAADKKAEERHRRTNER